MSEIVTFKLTNGDTFAIYRQTLEHYPNSFLTKLIINEANSLFHSRDADNAFVIDEDPTIFSSILTYYRCGVLTIVHDELRLAIIDKYMLPSICNASSMKNAVCHDNPSYVHLTLEHSSSSSTQVKPNPACIPALQGCPFIQTHTNSFRSTDPIEVANYLANRGYKMEQIDINTRAILMKRKDRY
jgi:hypothetical protein